MIYLYYSLAEVRFEKKAINSLIKWKINKDRKPLIISGARHVGKTWIMKEL